jgi:excisionase family DNA binding protein
MQQDKAASTLAEWVNQHQHDGMVATQRHDVKVVDYVNQHQAAEILGVSDSFLHKLLKNGKGPRFTALGGLKRFNVQELHRFMREGQTR